MEPELTLWRQAQLMSHLDVEAEVTVINLGEH
jgi:hypothetical protein